MIRSIYLVTAISLVLFTLPAGLLAEGTETEAVDTMEEVIVTATKTEEKRRDISNSVVTKNRMDIEEAPTFNVGEVLANEPGLDWRTRGNYGGAESSIHIRGFNGQGTQVFVNGTNVNSPSLATADVSKIPLNSIERIEVIKGPGSVLYGSGTMGGTVNIITKRPQRDKTDLAIGAGYGTENTYRIFAETGMFIKGDFGYYLTAGRNETDGFRDNSDLTHNDVSLNLVYDRGDALDISLYGDYIDRDYGLPGVKPPTGTQPFSFNGTPVYNQDSASLINRGEDEDMHATLKLKSTPLDWLTMTFLADYTYMDSYNLNRYYSTFPAPGVPGTKTWVTNEVAGVEGDFEFRPVDGTSILLGGEYRDYDYDNKTKQLDGNGTEIAGSDLTKKAGVYTRAAYAEAQWRPNPYFKLSAGAREQYHAYFGTEGVPRFGLVLNPWESTALKATHGKHFRAPSLNDLFWPDDGFTVGNPDLKPETGWSTDITLEQNLMKNILFFNGSYFKWDLDDKINWAEDPSNLTIFGTPYWTPSNVDQYEADGIELGAKIGPVKDLLLALSYTYLDATERLAGGVERQALYTPENLFKGSLTYWAPFDLMASLVVRYTGERPGRYADVADTKASSTLDEYWTTDVRLEQRLFEHWKLAITGNNLFDEQYDTYIGPFTDSAFTTTYVGFPGAGRSFFGSVTYAF